MADKDVGRLKKELRRQGWTIEKRRKYDYAYSPEGSVGVRLPRTPSSSRWLHNKVAELRRHGFVWKGR